MEALKVIEELRSRSKNSNGDSLAIFEHKGIDYAIVGVTIVDEDLFVYFEFYELSELESKDEAITWGRISRELSHIDYGYSADDEIVEEFFCGN